MGTERSSPKKSLESLLWYHGGGVLGFSSSIQRYPRERVCIIMLSNLGPSKPWEFGDHIASDLFNEPLPEQVSPAIHRGDPAERL